MLICFSVADWLTDWLTHQRPAQTVWLRNLKFSDYVPFMRQSLSINQFFNVYTYTLSQTVYETLYVNYLYDNAVHAQGELNVYDGRRAWGRWMAGDGGRERWRWWFCVFQNSFLIHCWELSLSLDINLKKIKQFLN